MCRLSRLVAIAGTAVVVLTFPVRAPARLPSPAVMRTAQCAPDRCGGAPLARYLIRPKRIAPGTKIKCSGLSDKRDRNDLIAFRTYR